MTSETATRGVLQKKKKKKKKKSQNSQENTCTRVFFLITFYASTCNFIKKRFWHMYFPMNSVSFLRKTFPVNSVQFLRTPLYRTP